MSDLNQFTFVGRLGKDPESKTLPSGSPVCNFTVAVGEKWKDKQSGEAKERVEWVGVAVFGPLAKICGDYLKKGSRLCGRGRLQTRKWQDKNGVDRWTTEVILDWMQMLDPKPAENGGQKPAAQKPAPKEAPDDGSDIPF